MDLCGLKEILYKIHNSVNKLLHWALVHFTDLTAGLLAHFLFRRHFHFLLSVLVMFGPVLSLWVSKYSIFGNKNHYLYRQDLILVNSRITLTVFECEADLTLYIYIYIKFYFTCNESKLYKS